MGMLVSLGLGALLLLHLAAGDRAAGTELGRPNVVIVMVDDMGFSDLGCYGGEIETPHLDRLAKGGLRFTQFYNAARCTPTRAALLTGVYPHQSLHRGALDGRCVTIAEALRSAGYATLMTGKWHVGSPPQHWPRQRGFDRYFGTPQGGGVYFKDTLTIRRKLHGEIFFILDDERVEIPDDFYVTDAFTDYALEFVDQAAAAGQPFFLYLAHIAPHFPLQAKPEDIAKYRGRYDAGWDAIRQARYDRQVEMGIIDRRWPLSPRDPRAGTWAEQSPEQQADLAERMAIYAAQIDSVDQNMGRLIERLQALGCLDDTLILFLSDNGCSAEGGPGGFNRGVQGAAIGTGLSWASGGLEWANVSDAPFRKFKKDAHEGGIATPLIAHWPAGIGRRGELEHQVGHVIDLMPTCLELAGADYPSQRNGHPTLPLEGISLVGAFRGEPLARREPLYQEHEGNRAIRDGKWKLVAARNGPWELYDMAADRTELNDLAEQRPEVAQRLRLQWEAWAERVGVPPAVRQP